MNDEAVETFKVGIPPTVFSGDDPEAIDAYLATVPNRTPSPASPTS